MPRLKLAAMPTARTGDWSAHRALWLPSSNPPRNCGRSPNPANLVLNRQIHLSEFGKPLRNYAGVNLWHGFVPRSTVGPPCIPRRKHCSSCVIPCSSSIGVRLSRTIRLPRKRHFIPRRRFIPASIPRARSNIAGGSIRSAAIRVALPRTIRITAGECYPLASARPISPARSLRRLPRCSPTARILASSSIRISVSTAVLVNTRERHAASSTRLVTPASGLRGLPRYSPTA